MFLTSVLIHIRYCKLSGGFSTSMTFNYMVVISLATASAHSYLWLPLPCPLCRCTLSVLSHFTEPMRFIILSNKSLGLVLFCFKRVNIITPLIVSIDVLLTINMSKTNTSTRIYTLDIYIWKDWVLFSCKDRYLGYNETSTITRTFAWSCQSCKSRVPLYCSRWPRMRVIIIEKWICH